MSGEPNDVLQAATRALREETSRPDTSARFTRLRVMASLRESEVRRRTQTVLLLPFAACLAVASAWGMAAGTITDMREAVTRALGIEVAPAEPSAKPAEKRPRRLAKPPSEPRPLAPVPGAPSDPEAAPANDPEPAPAPAPIEGSAETLDEAPKPLVNQALRPLRPRAAAPDPAHELYRAAHQAHFGGGDWQRALTAWEAYLRAAPRGRLAPEARYNRALCLARLGRTAAAREALEPFARASAGSYRQREASELLAVLAEN